MTRHRRREWNPSDVVAQLCALGVEAGGVLLVHPSFWAAGPVSGGPRGLIEALRQALGPEGTLVMPSWTGDDDAPFDPFSTPAAAELGVIADTFWRMPDVARSAHAQAFAATGPATAFITQDPLALPPHVPASPIGRVYDLNGQVLLLGVGHEANTTLHLAESLARVPYAVPLHCTVLRQGQLVRIEYAEPDHCCERFALADGWLRTEGLQAEGPVGHAQARLLRARDVVRLALERLERNPLLFLHPLGVGCADCEAARRSLVARSS